MGSAMTLDVTLIQTSLAWEDAASNRAHLGELVRQVEGSDLVVLPEMFSTGFSMRSTALAESMDGETLRWMRSIAAETDKCLCGSVIIKDGGHHFNRFLLVRPGGEIVKFFSIAETA